MRNNQLWIAIVFGSLFILSALGLVLIYHWDQEARYQKQLPTLKEMSQKIERLQDDMKEVDLVIADLETSLEIKEALLEEKNFELTFFQHQVKEMEKQKQMGQQELEKLRTQLIGARKQLKAANLALADQEKRQGLVFRVQIGILQGEGLPLMLSDPAAFMIEEEGEIQKYILGSFRDYEQALSFRDAIRTMGLPDAWVVPYLDGIRTDIQTAEQFQATQATYASQSID